MQPASGDCINKALGLVAGAEKRMGPRPDQQDYFETCATVSEDIDGGNPLLCAFGVYDGHGGDAVAKYLAKHMCGKLVNATATVARENPRGLQEAIEKCYLDVDAIVCGLSLARNAGSCVVTAQLIGDSLVVANAGDCEAWLCRNGEPVELTVPHKAENPAEQTRIAAAGGRIYGGNQRLASVLAVTRNFGAFNVKSMEEARGLTALPHVSIVPLQPGDEFLVMGSDGLFDRFPNRQNLMNYAKEQLRSTRSAKATAKAITDHVLDERNGTDNTTVMVVVFNQLGVHSASAGAYGVAPGFAQATGRCRTALRARSRSIARDMMDEAALGAAAAAVAGESSAAAATASGDRQPAIAAARATVPTLTSVPDCGEEDDESDDDGARSENSVNSRSGTQDSAEGGGGGEGEGISDRASVPASAAAAPPVAATPPEAGAAATQVAEASTGVGGSKSADAAASLVLGKSGGGVVGRLRMSQPPQRFQIELHLMMAHHWGLHRAQMTWQMSLPWKRSSACRRQIGGAVLITLRILTLFNMLAGISGFVSVYMIASPYSFLFLIKGSMGEASAVGAISPQPTCHVYFV